MRSMTGFGRSVAATDAGTITVEMKAVNHRYCQVSLRLPPKLSTFEPQATSLIRQCADRGHISASVDYAATGSGRAATLAVDVDLARAYAQRAREVLRSVGVEDSIPAASVLTFPGVISTAEPERDAEALWKLLEKGLQGAWDEVVAMREREGDQLRREMTDRLASIGEIAVELRATVPDLVEHYRERLTKRIKDLTRDGHDVDESRVVLEAGLLADRSDVTEELTRLDSHMEQLRDCLNSPDAVGRQMDFLLQEMNREANTISSKVPNANAVALCVRMKTEIERLREQAQNVE